MLPGFRFLLAAIVLSTSILVFGLGAAALLRAAHEQFASNPALRAAPEPKFAQPIDVSPPVLAMLRVEPEPEQNASDAGPASAAPAEPPAAIPSPAEPDRIAALNPEDSTPPETMKPELPASDTAFRDTDLSASADSPAPAGGKRIAAVEPVLTPADPEAVPAPEPAPAPAATEPDIAAPKIATLGGPPVAIEAEPKRRGRQDRQRRRQKAHPGTARQGAPQAGAAHAGGTPGRSPTGSRSVLAAGDHTQPLS